MDALFWTVLALLGAERLFELVLSRRHLARLLARGGRLVQRDGFAFIVAVHTALFLGMIAERSFAPWAGEHVLTWVLLGLALLAQGLRYWVVWALGDRWCTRVVVLPREPLVTHGPYRFARHPNYVAIVLELAVLPLAFGLFATALAVSFANAIALARRIRVENAALGAYPKTCVMLRAPGR